MIQTVLIGLMVNAHSVHLVLILGLMESVNQSIYCVEPMMRAMEIVFHAILHSSQKEQNVLKMKDLPLKILSVASFKMEYV